MSDYKTVSAKLGPISDATRSKSKEIFDAAKKAGHEIRYMWGYDNNASNTEHHSKLALDLMVNNEAAGDWIRNYIWANRQRLQLQHVIWEQHITSTVTQPGVRRLMADRGNTTANHYDHVHVLFFTGEYKAPGDNKPGPAPTKPTVPVKKSVTEAAKAVLRGEYGDGDERIQKLRKEGYDPHAVQAEVNRIRSGRPATKKTISQVANEIAGAKGGWGNGADRVARLKAAGYDPKIVQAEVNRIMTPKGERKPKLTVAQVASQVIAGKWGVDPERKARLIRAGYNYDAVQAEVNRRF